VKCGVLLQNRNRLGFGLWLLIGLSSVFAPYCINAITGPNPSHTCGSVHFPPFSSRRHTVCYLSTEQFEHNLGQNQRMQNKLITLIGVVFLDGTMFSDKSDLLNQIYPTTLCHQKIPLQLI